MTPITDLIDILDDLLRQSHSIGLSEGHSLHSRGQTNGANADLAEDRAKFIEQLRHQQRATREAVAALMFRNGLATGHGDTVEDLLGELEPQVVALMERVGQQHAADAPKWMPIETCPLDTWVLLWWVPNTENPTSIRLNSAVIKAQVSSYEPGCYWAGDGLGVLECKAGYGPLRLITHWQPLPPPPAK